MTCLVAQFLAFILVNRMSESIHYFQNYDNFPESSLNHAIQWCVTLKTMEGCQHHNQIFLVRGTNCLLRWLSSMQSVLWGGGVSHEYVHATQSFCTPSYLPWALPASPQLQGKRAQHIPLEWGSYRGRYRALLFPPHTLCHRSDEAGWGEGERSQDREQPLKGLPPIWGANSTHPPPGAMGMKVAIYPHIVFHLICTWSGLAACKWTMPVQLQILKMT